MHQSRLKEPKISRAAYLQHALAAIGRLFASGLFIWKGLTAIVLNLAGALLFVVIVMILVEVLGEHTVAVESITVPISLQEDGYTQDVAARRLRDALAKYEVNAQNKHIDLRYGADALGPKLAVPTIRLDEDLPSFVVPTIGLSIESIATYIRSFFRNGRRRNISGEITVVQKKLSLRLRKNGVEFYTSDATLQPTDVDDLFDVAAQKVFEVTEPYLVAETLANVDPTKSIKLAQQVINDSPVRDPKVAWSHYLIGTILYNKWRMKEAINEFTQAINSNYSFAAAHNNLGIALQQDGQLEQAINEFRKVIELDGELAPARINLASVLRLLGKNEEAETQFQIAMAEFQRINPLSALALNNFGMALRAWGRWDDAVMEYQKAINIEPDYALAHYNLGSIFFASKKYNEALLEYRRAAAIDPFYSNDHNVAFALFGLHQTDAADREMQSEISKLKAAVGVDDFDANAHEELASALASEGDVEEAVRHYDRALTIFPNYGAAATNRGVIVFASGNAEEAVPNFVLAGQWAPNNLYYKIWLYLARARLGNQSARKDLDISTSSFNQTWPYGVVKLFLGQEGPDETLREAATPNAACEAAFYIGEWHLLQGGDDTATTEHRLAAKRFLKEAASTCPHSFQEWIAASVELQRMGR